MGLERQVEWKYLAVAIGYIEESTINKLSASKPIAGAVNGASVASASSAMTWTKIARSNLLAFKITNNKEFEIVSLLKNIQQFFFQVNSLPEKVLYDESRGKQGTAFPSSGRWCSLEARFLEKKDVRTTLRPVRSINIDQQVENEKGAEPSTMALSEKLNLHRFATVKWQFRQFLEDRRTSQNMLMR